MPADAVFQIPARDGLGNAVKSAGLPPHQTAFPPDIKREPGRQLVSSIRRDAREYHPFIIDIVLRKTEVIRIQSAQRRGNKKIARIKAALFSDRNFYAPARPVGQDQRQELRGTVPWSLVRIAPEISL